MNISFFEGFEKIQFKLQGGTKILIFHIEGNYNKVKEQNTLNVILIQSW